MVFKVEMLLFLKNNLKVVATLTIIIWIILVIIGHDPIHVSMHDRVESYSTVARFHQDKNGIEKKAYVMVQIKSPCGVKR